VPERAPHVLMMGHFDVDFTALHQPPPLLSIFDSGLTTIDGVFLVYFMLLCLLFMCLFLDFFCCIFSLFNPVLVFVSLRLNIHHKSP
jgi:hypothetical protein